MCETVEKFGGKEDDTFDVFFFSYSSVLTACKPYLWLIVNAGHWSNLEIKDVPAGLV